LLTDRYAYSLISGVIIPALFISFNMSSFSILTTIPILLN
jgi:hypothetical protein